MQYTINFNNDSVEKYFLDLYHSFEWSERSFEDGDLSRNIVNTTTFCQTLMHLETFGADTERGTYNDNGYIRIGYAKINGHEFVKNSLFNPQTLNDALWEIAHPQMNEVVKGA